MCKSQTNMAEGQMCRESRRISGLLQLIQVKKDQGLCEKKMGNDSLIKKKFNYLNYFIWNIKEEKNLSWYEGLL